MGNRNSTNIVAILAQRFLLSRNSDGFLTLIAWVSVVGVALGVAALITVTSVINGFEGELIRVITGANGDVILYSKGSPIPNHQEVQKKIYRVLPDAKAITPIFVGELMIAGEHGVSGVVLEGFDGESAPRVTRLHSSAIEGEIPKDEESIALGYAVAEKIGAEVGDEIRLIAPFAMGEVEGGTAAAKTKSYRVSGLIKLGMFRYDSKFVYGPMKLVQDFLERPGFVTGFKIRLNDVERSQEAAQDLNDNFGYPYRAKDWGQLNKNLLYAIQLEKVAIAIILCAIVLVAAFNVVSTLMMMIYDKTQEIAILKAMGLKPSQSFLLFCIIGTGIGIVGASLGLLGGLGLNWLVEQATWFEIPADIYNIGFLPVVVKWIEIALILLFALLMCFVATLYPAFQVSKRSPLEGIRYE